MLQLAGGIALLMVAVFMFIGFLAGGGQAQGIGITFVAFGVAVMLPGTVGLSLLRRHLRRVPAAPDETAALAAVSDEARVVHLAETLGGRLTVIEVVGELGLGGGRAEAVLAGLVAQGMAEVEMTDSGLTVYVFGDILRLKDKGTSHDLLAGG